MRLWKEKDRLAPQKVSARKIVFHQIVRPNNSGVTSSPN